MAVGSETSVNDLGETVRDRVEDLKEKVTEAAAVAKEKLSDLGRQTARQIDASREPTADALENAASTLQAQAGKLPGSPTLRSAARSTAHGLESTAGYLRQHDLTAMGTDIQYLVRRNPGASLLVAVGIGFLIGRAFRGKS